MSEVTQSGGWAIGPDGLVHQAIQVLPKPAPLGDGFLMKTPSGYTVHLRNSEGTYDRARELPVMLVWSDERQRWEEAT